MPCTPYIGPSNKRVYRVIYPHGSDSGFQKGIFRLTVKYQNEARVEKFNVGCF